MITVFEKKYSKGPIGCLSIQVYHFQGLSELRRQLVNMALDCELFPHTGQLLKPEQLRLCELIDQAQAMGKLLITWAEYR